MSSNDLWPADPVSYPDLFDFLAVKIVRDPYALLSKVILLVGLRN